PAGQVDEPLEDDDPSALVLGATDHQEGAWDLLSLGIDRVGHGDHVRRHGCTLIRGRTRVRHPRPAGAGDCGAPGRPHLWITVPLPTTTRPLSVTVKPRARSSSWSTPILTPAGTATSLSMIARWI